MKTVKEWLETLPIEYRDKALANLRPDVAKKECETLYAALDYAFAWDKTPEGYDFWENVHNYAFYSFSESNTELSL